MNVILDHIQSENDKHALTNVTRDQVLNVNQDRIQPKNIISQPDVDHITLMDPDDEDIEDQTKDQNHMTSPIDLNFKANRLTSLQLKTAKAMLDKEISELQHKTVAEMSLDHRTSTTPYADHYEEQDHISPLYFSSFIVTSPGCYKRYIL